MSAPSGVPCLSLVNDVVQANALNRKVLEQVFHVMDQAFDYLVIDLALLTGDVGAFLLDRTDQMCVVVDPSPQGVARAGHLLGLLRAAQVPPTAIGALRQPRHRGAHRHGRRAASGRRCWPTWPTSRRPSRGSSRRAAR